MPVNVADAAAGQDVPQADGAVLAAARQNHRLGQNINIWITVIITDGLNMGWAFFVAALI